MKIAILTFEGFNELDSFIAYAMLNRVKRPALQALIVCPAAQVASRTATSRLPEVACRPTTSPRG